MPIDVYSINIFTGSPGVGGTILVTVPAGRRYVIVDMSATWIDSPPNVPRELRLIGPGGADAPIWELATPFARAAVTYRWSGRKIIDEGGVLESTISGPGPVLWGLEINGYDLTLP